MSLYSLFGTDQDAEKEGFELVLFDADIEIKFQIARAGGSNKKYAAKMQQLMRPHQHAASVGSLDDDVAEKILITVMSECLILGWENVAGPDGETIEFSVEACKRLLKDLPELRDVIWAEANKVANFIAVDREEQSEK